MAGQPGVTRGAGQRLAREELAKAIYHPSAPFWIRIYEAVRRALAGFYDVVSRMTPGGWWGFVALAALLVIVIGVVVVSAGPVARRRRRSPEPRQAGRPLTARQLRERAQRLAQAGDFSAAVIEGMRTIAAGLEERAVIMPDPGLTADELAGQAAQALPGQADALRQAARLFDGICYGQRRGTREEYEKLRNLDTALLSLRAPRGVSA